MGTNILPTKEQLNRKNIKSVISFLNKKNTFGLAVTFVFLLYKILSILLKIIAMKKILFILLAFIPFLVNAQNTMYFMDELPQNSKFNPSFMPEMRFYLELPGISGNSFDIYNSGFNYNEIDKFIDDIEDPNYNPDNFINSIGDYNSFISEFSTNILTMGF